MAWREKTAWITLVAMGVTYGVYFTLISRESLSTLSMLELFAVVTVLQVIAVVTVTSVLAALSSEEARAKPDERDRAVARRGASIAYFVLIVGVITVGVVMPFRDSGWRLTNATLFALVIAETVRYLTVVVSYRRGWHG
jgi:cytochrome bd-type quinol oxidase subunit 2